jgi:hypothetical protein
VVAENAAPWIASDLADYPPGALVTLSGGSWVPGQTVEIFVDDDGVADEVMGPWSLNTTVVANASGQVYYQFNLAPWFVADYFVTATGECSTAKTAFTDKTNTVTSLARTTGTNPSNAGDTIAFTATVTGAPKGQGVDPTPNSVGTVTFRTGTTVLCANVPLSGNTASCTTTTLQGGVHSITATYNGTSPGDGFSTSTSPSLSHTVNTASASSLSVSAASGTYGGAVTLTAKLRTSGGSPISGQTVNFSVNGTSVGTATTNASGDATLNNVSISGINAGTYPNAVAASFTATSAYGASSGTAALTVTQATATLSLAEADLAQTFGATKAVGVTITPAGLHGVEITYNGSATVPTAPGNYAVVASLTNPNYAASNATGTLVISPATATLTLGNLTGHTYDGRAKAATVTTSPAGLEADVTFTYNGASTAPTAAGTYDVVATLDNDNYTGTASGQLVIKKATAELTLTGLAHTYDGDQKSASVETDPEGLDGVSLTYDGSTTAPMSAGTYKVEATLTNANYTAAPVSGDLAISPATSPLGVTSATVEYDGSEKSVEVTGALQGVDVLITYNGSEDLPVNAGTYTVEATLVSGNYTGTATGTLQITKATATLTVTNASQVYTGGTLAATIDTVPSGLDGLAVTYHLNGEGDAVYPLNVGSYGIRATLDNPNYTLDFDGATFEITKAPAILTLNVDDLEQVYDSTGKDVRVTLPNGVDGTVSVLYDNSPTPPSEVGTYEVVATLANDNYSGTVSGQLVITPAPVTITVNNQSKVYGAADPDLTFSISGGATLDDIDGALVRSSGNDVGEYAITQGDLSITNPNYTLKTFIPGTLTITPAPVTVTADAGQGKVYGTDGPVLTFKIAGGANPDDFTGALSREGGENVGAYAIIQGTLVLVNNNYEMTFAGANFEITARPIEVTANSVSKTYGEADPALSYDITNGSLVTGDSFTGELVREAGENVGTYDILQGTLELDSNYSLTFVGADFEITRAEATLVLTGTDLAQVFNGSIRTVGYATTPAGLSGVTVEYFIGDGTDPVTPVNAGTYRVVATLDNPNYNVVVVEDELEITQADATVTLGGLEHVYTGHPVAASVITEPEGLEKNVQLRYFQGETEVFQPTQAGDYSVIATLVHDN